jgi:hypothetical protein
MMKSKIQSLVDNAFEERGDLSDRMWEKVQSALESEKQAKEQAEPDFTHSEEEDGGQGSKEQAPATTETEEVIPRSTYSECIARWFSVAHTSGVRPLVIPVIPSSSLFSSALAIEASFDILASVEEPESS